MDQHQHLRKARERARCNAANRRANTIFVLSYRGGGEAQIKGYALLADTLRIKQSSIPVLLSQGGGASFTLMRGNPLTGERDMLTVTRILPAKLLRLRRGRPTSVATQTKHAELTEYQREQDAYAAKLREQRDRHKSCSSAKTVPKRTNRRRSEKSESP